jgi:hypothetical protein
VKAIRDLFIGEPRLNSKGMRVEMWKRGNVEERGIKVDVAGFQR